MSSQSSDSSLLTATKSRRRKLFTIGLWILPGIALLGLAFYFGMARFKARRSGPASSQTQTYSELVASKGTVLLLRSDQTEWQAVTTGERLTDGDLIQTDSGGSAKIRYPNGTVVSIQAQTIFAIQRSGNNEMEILMPSEPAASGDSSASAAGANAGSKAEAPKATRAGQLRPSLTLQRIVPFGRSLELIGYVEAGSSLTVNGETVEVGGDGFFKHFTNPFPKSTDQVELILKATNLAGKASILTATHDFRSQGGAN